jgi:hypothetical protein
MWLKLRKTSVLAEYRNSDYTLETRQTALDDLG